MVSRRIGWRCVGTLSVGGRMVTCTADGRGPAPLTCPKCGKQTVIGTYVAVEEHLMTVAPVRHTVRSSSVGWVEPEPVAVSLSKKP